MAIIIMLTAGINTEIITASAKSPTTVSASVKTKSSPKKNKKKNKKKTKSKKTKKKNKKKKQKHIHYMPKGNMVRLRPLAVRDEGSNKNLTHLQNQRF